MTKRYKTGGRKPAPAGAKARFITLTDSELFLTRQLVKLLRSKSGPILPGLTITWDGDQFEEVARKTSVSR